MKLHLLSLVPFLAFATSVKGGRVRKSSTRRASTATEGLSLFVEQPSVKAAPVDLTKAQNRIGLLVGDLEPRQSNPPELDYVYNQCEEGIASGNGYVAKNTTKIYGEVTPITGCIALKSEKFEGGIWITSGEVTRPCVGDTAYTLWWEDFATYSVDVFEADGDSFLMKVCWD